MALTMDVTTDYGTLEDAYIKVGKIVGTKTGVSVYVNVYKDSEAEKVLTELTPDADMENMFAFVPVDTNNWLKQAYTHLKTLDQFSEATDC